VLPRLRALGQKILEDIVKHVPESATAEIKPLKAGTTLLCPGMTEHVVAFSPFLIAQRFVSFVDFFKLLFSGFLLLVACVKVRMMLAGQFPVGFFQVIVGHIPIDAENFVVIAFGHGHCVCK